MNLLSGPAIPCYRREFKHPLSTGIHERVLPRLGKRCIPALGLNLLGGCLILAQGPSGSK